jgi:anti-sigma B factor antagonist
MQVLIEERMSDVAVLSIQGDALVSTGVAGFKQQMEELAARTSRVVVDLSTVQFIDSAGGSVLLKFHKLLMDRGGGLKVCCLTPPVRALFDLVRMQRVLAIYPSREQALRSFEG